jgi:uncharacterized protein (TIGR04255 family)
MSVPEGKRPDFDSPPVVEVALGVQFNPLATLAGPAIAEYWIQNLRDRFPNAEEQPPLEPVVEWFGVPRPAPLTVRLGRAPGRWWLIDAQRNNLVQIQQDRFFRNWRQVEPGDLYPRYEIVRAAFETEFTSFLTFIDARGIGPLEPYQCEITYVNRIPFDTPSQPGDPGWFLAPWSGGFSDDFFRSPPESVEVAVHHVIRDQLGTPVGRLHTSVGPAWSLQDGTQATLMQLTARGRPAGKSVKDVLNFLDLGREYVVRGFASLTTPAAHSKWGRKDGDR